MKTIEPKYTNSANAHIKIGDYEDLYNESINNTDEFWAKIADRISWDKKWDKISDVDYSSAHIKWFEGGKLNACYNCIDRHV